MRFLRRLSLLAKRRSAYIEMSGSTSTLTQAPRLPVEIIRQIMRFLRYDSRASLIPLMLTCRSLRVEAEAVLYTTMADFHPESHFRFLNSIVKNPRLAALVIRYGMYERHVGLPFMKLLNKGLKSMVNLRELSFREHFSYGRMQTRVLDGFSARLTAFTWNLKDVDESSRVAITAFLKSQSLLEHLYIHWPGEWGAPDSSSCAGLTSLRGDTGTIVAWAPGRPIRTLHWETGNDEEDIGRIDKLTKTLSSVWTLHLGDHSHNSNFPSLRTIAPIMTSLDKIELIRRPLDEIDHLPLIPHLKHVIITSPPFIPDPFVLVNTLFAKINVLESVSIHVNNPMEGHLTRLFLYRTWDRTCTRREMTRIVPDPVRDQRICKYPEWLMWL